MGYSNRGGRQRGFSWTGRNILAVIGLIGMLGSGIFWWPIQNILSDNPIIAAAMTLFLMLVPAALWAFLVPSTPAGMLLQRFNAQTWGFWLTFVLAIFFTFYEFTMINAWWLTQQVTVKSGMLVWQTALCLVVFIFVPALCLPAVTSEEMVEQIRQAQMVERYKLQAEADIAILRSTLLEAQKKAAIGFAKLTIEEREELAGVMRGLLSGIDRTLNDVGASVQRLTGTYLEFDALEDSQEVGDILGFLEKTLVDGTEAPRRRSGTTAMHRATQGARQ